MADQRDPLYAAAPELLAECRRIVAWFDRLAAKQEALLGRDFDQACANWDEATIVEPLDLRPTKALLARLEQ